MLSTNPRRLCICSLGCVTASGSPACIRMFGLEWFFAMVVLLMSWPVAWIPLAVLGLCLLDVWLFFLEWLLACL